MVLGLGHLPTRPPPHDGAITHRAVGRRGSTPTVRADAATVAVAVAVVNEAAADAHAVAVRVRLTLPSGADGPEAVAPAQLVRGGGGGNYSVTLTLPRPALWGPEARSSTALASPSDGAAGHWRAAAAAAAVVDSVGERFGVRSPSAGARRRGRPQQPVDQTARRVRPPRQRPAGLGDVRRAERGGSSC